MINTRDSLMYESEQDDFVEVTCVAVINGKTFRDCVGMRICEYDEKFFLSACEKLFDTLKRRTLTFGLQKEVLENE